MSRRRTCTAANGEEQPCPLRGLNICDGATVYDSRDQSLRMCFCADESLMDAVGWTGARDGYAKSRSEVLAAAVLHPAGHLRRS